jgi:hypothetical protein
MTVEMVVGGTAAAVEATTVVEVVAMAVAFEGV